MVLRFFAHLHPLIIHLPIGILMLAFVLECLARWKAQTQLQPAIQISIRIGATTAALSVATGLLLEKNGDYDPAMVNWHQWWGITTATLACLLWWGQSTRWYFPLFVGTTASLLVTGHLGGTLTHGSDYLLQNHDEIKATKPPEFSPDSTVYTSLIQPLLISRCGACHKPEKHKGELVLVNPNGLLAGGKHGAAIVFGRPDSSELIKRLHLPATDEHRMPPKGKTQLNDAEIKLLEWWISTGAAFDGLNRDFPLPEPLKTQFSGNNPVPSNPVFSLRVPAVSPETLAKLKAAGIHVEKNGTDQPWLAVAMIALPVISAEQWKLLGEVRDNVIDLDLSYSGLQDRDAERLNFPHLVRLNLAGIHELHQTAFLSDMPYLEQVNLTQTGISKDIGQFLPALKQLRHIHLWQTSIDSATVKIWQQQMPRVDFNLGGVVLNPEPLTLRTPDMLYDKSFFDDTLHVDLNFPFKNVDIYYTLDEAASPTTQSPKYEKTLVLDKTTHLRAFAAKEGWSNSPIIDAQFHKNTYKIAHVSLAGLPSTKYPAHGAPSLIDGKVGSIKSDETWLGYEGEHMEATLDMGSAVKVSSVSVHCMENNGSWIFVPKGIEVSTSNDGVHYQKSGYVTFPVNKKMGLQLPYLLDCPLHAPVQARYVRVKVISLLKNPPWHPGKGQKCWIFVDELTVN